jgi:hypothetical protein
VAQSDKPGLPAGMEPDPTAREVVWGVESRPIWTFPYPAARPARFCGRRHAHRLHRPEWPGIRACRSRASARSTLACARTNTWGERPRVNQPSPAYDRATPIEVGHVVFFVTDLAAVSGFYQQQLGFAVSDRYPERGCFLRCAPTAATTTCSCCSCRSPSAA